MLRRVVVLLFLVLAAGPATGVLTGSPAPPVGSATEQVRPPQTTPEGFNNTAFRIQVYENGSARWTVQHTTPLNSQSEIDQFRSYAADFNARETQVYRNFRVRADRLTAYGTNATGREMNATNFDREARINRIGQTRGVIELSFLWTGFARTEGERIVVDDVFEGGMYIDTGQRLVIARGPNLTFVRVRPQPDSRENADDLAASETVTWFGERQFADNRPLAALSIPDANGTGPPSTSPTDDRPTETPLAPSDESRGLLPLVLVLLVVLGLGGGLAWYAGAMPPFDGPGDASSTDASSAEPPSDGTVHPTATAGETAEPVVADEELLSDEDRVLQLLEENGGRMKQVNIVEETDWSKSKVSMLLSEMEDDGTVSKLRVGRENIISLPGEEPDAVGSPFDDE